MPGTGEVDGIIDAKIAVEIGVGSTKQVRGCALDLIAHPLKGKLLILVDTPGHSTEPSVIQAATIIGRAGFSALVVRLPGGDAAVDLGVYRADLSEAVSKYIDETAKNLVRVFDAVEHEHDVLFFDEADGLFGRRGELETETQ